MPIPKVITQPDSAIYLKQGFDQMAELLAITLGPSQGHVVNKSQKSGRPETLNDAATIARRMIALPDRRQDVGAMMLRQLVWRIHKQVGDGSATTAVLAQAILRQATRMVAAGANVVFAQRGIQKAADMAQAALREMAQPINGQEDLAAVAQAVTGSPDLAWVLGEMFDLLGAQAYITVENYVAPYLERAYYEGGRWSGQIVSPYFITSPATGQAIHKDCSIALYAGHLQEMEPLKPLLDIAARQTPPHLLLVAPEISGQAVNLLAGAHTHPKNKLKITAFALKIGGAKGQQELNDLALLAGATLLGEEVGRPLASIKPQDLGHAGRIEAGQNELFVIQGGGDGPAIREQISAWQTRLDALEADAEEREEVQLRLTRLSGNAGILKIGAHTKAERDVLRQKAEQGLKVLAATLAEGALPGGGIAYVRAAAQINPDQADHPDERMGMIALKQALSAPFFRILQNAHVPAPGVILNDVLNCGPDAVYDVIRGQICSARDSGVLDAAKIVRQVLETAASGAMMALSVDVTVLKRRPVTNVNYEP
jgi:chaperonin GroEL